MDYGNQAIRIILHLCRRLKMLDGRAKRTASAHLANLSQGLLRQVQIDPMARNGSRLQDQNGRKKR